MKYENKTLSLVVDMYGCTNRCKHCWITPMPNGHMKDEEAEALVNYFKPYFTIVQVNKKFFEIPSKNFYLLLYFN